MLKADLDDHHTCNVFGDCSCPDLGFIASDFTVEFDTDVWGSVAVVAKSPRG